MCGIAGYKLKQAPDSAALNELISALSHRGPDGTGFFRDRDFAAGMCRLAINDLEGGSQPLFNHDRSVALVYNGEIYNYRELRAKLEAQGVIFRTRSDGEVICHLYDRHGIDLFERLDGMFAVALWDSRNRRLILARDLPGEKPLHYAERGPGEVVFASEIAALKTFPGLNLALNQQAIWDFPTFLWVPEPDTIFQHIKALPPGHLLIVESDKTDLRRYRNLFNLTSFNGDPASVTLETRRVVEAAVKSRLLSDVPVGSFLSGGLDSSIVASIAARELKTLDTFSIGFENLSDPYHGTADESEQASTFAKIIGSQHHEIRVTAKSCRSELERFCEHGDQPFAVSSGLGILAIAKVAREHGIKVLLSGDGADEAFGGYSWYALLNQIPRSGTLPNAIVSYQNFGLTLENRLDAISHLDQSAQAWAWHYYAHDDEKAALFSSDFTAGKASSLRHFVLRHSPAKPLDFIEQDRQFYFPNEMLRKLDRMTMAYSVEARAPFAAPMIYSHVQKLEFEDLLSRDGTLKKVLRAAFADMLPADIVGRPKHGFNVPIDHWLKNEWSDLVDMTFAPSSALSRMRLISSNAEQVAHDMLHDPQRLNGHTIFCMIMLNLWLEQNLDANHR